jgi:ribonucleoside-diphosphate reductase alpha chain
MCEKESLRSEYIEAREQDRKGEQMEEKKFLKLKRFYTDGITHPFDKLEWTTSKVEIKDMEGNVIFNQDVEHPVSWDYMSVRVCADKYFKIKDLEKHPNGGERSVRDVMHRVAFTIAMKGRELGYLDEEGEKILYDELCYILINQIAAFNSPVFFNMGIWDVYGFKGTSSTPRWAIRDKDKEVYVQDFEYQQGQYSACKAADTLVFTKTHGKVTIKWLFDNLKDIKEDLYIYGTDWSKFVAVKYNGKKLTYKVTLEDSDYEPLRITGDDQMLVHDMEYGQDSYETIESLLGKEDLYVRYCKPGFFTGISKIKSIEAYKEEDVYDIETEAHNFSANGIVVHNCFITQVKDELINGENGIYDWITTEMSIFASGSGSGVNISDIRGKDEPVTGGGKSSGIISFLEVADASAGVIKSGGKNRRAAKMVVLDDNHPDLLEFVNWKKEEEFKARALILSGYAQNYFDDKGAYKSVQAQNANNAIMFSDAFMDAVMKDGSWDLKYVLNKQIKKTHKANEVLNQIVDAIWECGDPGAMFSDTMNRWNTIPNTGRIRGTNPCAEYIFPDGSCSLNSLNVIKFLKEDRSFDIEGFKHVAEMMTTAQEIIVAIGSFPNKHIAEFTRDTRPIGVGYCNMGGLIMLLGYPYDSDQARSIISTVTSLLTASVYGQSARIAGIVGTFPEYDKNKQEFNRVIKKHSDATVELKPKFKFTKLIHQSALDSWTETQNLIHKYGARNAQATVIAPCGCLTGDALVLTSNGLLPINTLGEPNGAQWQDMDVTILQENKTTIADKFYVNGKQEVFEILSRRGHQIKCTAEHKLRILDRNGDYIWKKVKDIETGDELVLSSGGYQELMEDKEYVPLLENDSHHSNTNASSISTVLDEETAEYLGYYMGDGCANHDRGIMLIVCDQDQDLFSYFDKYHDKIGVTHRTDAGRGAGVIRTCSVNQYNWFEVNNFLKPKGNCGRGAAGAFIPQQILQSKPSVVYAFIRGFFEADGTVCNNIVEMSSVSEKLVRSLHVLLESLGILCTVTQQKAKNCYGKRDKFRLHILNQENVVKFAKLIGFMSKRKNKKLSAILDIKNMEERDSHRGNYFRNDALIEDLLIDKNLGWRLRGEIRSRKTHSCSLEYVKRLIEKHPSLSETKIGKLLSLYGDNIQIVHVTQKKSLGEQSTYDISVPENNTYRANGFISHNTIGLLMGATLTGIEPSFSLMAYKMMSDGSMTELVCGETVIALKDLGYNQTQIKDITDFIKSNGHVEGAPYLNPVHYPVFDTANISGNGKRFIRPMAHVEAVAAAAPFLSGGISKTINLPEDATREDVRNCIIEGWKMGVKGLALYRSGSKWSQPLNSKNPASRKEVVSREVKRVKERIGKSDFYKNSPNDMWEYTRGLMTRKKASGRAPSERLAFNLGSENIWMNVVRYPDNGISEVWIEVGKENPTVNGLADTIGRIVSVAIQYGVPMDAICETMEGLQFQPAGFVLNHPFPFKSAKSLSDLSAKVLMTLHKEYSQIPTEPSVLEDAVNILPVHFEKEGDEPEILSEVEQARAKGFSGVRCEQCGSWKCTGTVKCGICLSCQTAYGTCSG